MSITDELDQQARATAADVLQACITAAAGGDTRQAALLLDRVWPSRDGRVLTFDLPEIERPADVATALDAALRLARTGVLTLREAKLLTEIINARAATFTSTDVDDRLNALDEAVRRARQAQYPRAVS